mmetsp:Transcript_92375/g.187993  ORF Transcript_92375/g.187993 Transcript_92375/m.187993 type:complete len:284 (+) Transcript_92375:3-854(+)
MVRGAGAVNAFVVLFMDPTDFTYLWYSLIVAQGLILWTVFTGFPDLRGDWANEIKANPIAHMVGRFNSELTEYSRLFYNPAGCALMTTWLFRSFPNGYLMIADFEGMALGGIKPWQSMLFYLPPLGLSFTAGGIYGLKYEKMGAEATWLWSIRCLYVGEVLRFFNFVSPVFGWIGLWVCSVFIMGHDATYEEVNKRIYGGQIDRYSQMKNLIGIVVGISYVAVFALVYDAKATTTLGMAAPSWLCIFLRLGEVAVTFSSWGSWRYIREGLAQVDREAGFQKKD